MDVRRRHPMPLNGDAAREPIKIVSVWSPQHFGFIDASDAMTRVGQPRCELAVVGENEQAFGVKVESADGVDVLPDSGQQINDGWPALRVRSCGDVAARLV